MAWVSSQAGPDPTPHPAAHTAAGAVSLDATPPNRLPDTSARSTTTSLDAEAQAGADPTHSDTRRDNDHDTDTDTDDPADPDDPQAPDTITTNPVIAAALLGGGIAVGATTMAVIAAARPARALQVVPPIAYDTPDGPPVHHRVNHPVNGPGGAGAPARSWSAAAPPSSTTPSSIPPPGGGSGTVASPSPRIGGAPPGHRVCLGPDSVSAALDAFTTFPGRDRPSPADAAAEHNQPRDHSGPQRPQRPSRPRDSLGAFCAPGGS